MNLARKKKEIAVSSQIRKEIYTDVTKEEIERKNRPCMNCLRVTSVMLTVSFYGILFILFVFYIGYEIKRT